MNIQEKRIKEAILRHTRKIAEYEEQLKLLKGYEVSSDITAAIESVKYYTLCEEAMLGELKETLANLYI